MNYQNITTKEVKTYNTIRQENKSVSLPKDGTEMLMDIWHVITTTQQPSYDKYTEAVRELPPVNYVQTWEVYALTQEQIDANILNAQVRKTNECDNYGLSLIDGAYANPQVGVTNSSTRGRGKANSRRNDNSDKVASEIPLSQVDKDQAKLDQKISAYEIKIWKDSDKAISNMLKLNTAIEITNFDVSAENWTVWNPPN